MYGNNVHWFSPDEIAAIIDMDARFKALADVKRVFPGAEMSREGPCGARVPGNVGGEGKEGKVHSLNSTTSNEFQEDDSNHI